MVYPTFFKFFPKYSGASLLLSVRTDNNINIFRRLYNDKIDSGVYTSTNNRGH